MTSRPFDIELNLRQHGAALRQLAAELLGDGAASDDAVQETWLRTLQSPPRHEAAHAGWLATVLRNVARRLRRGERRRVLREAVVARTDAAEDPETMLAREELVHRLVAEVSALEAPFREAIWRRFFEGLAPREIAASSGVPVATVKSRLQRGLQQLREKLGEDGESGWRSALAVAFGMKEGAVPAGAAGTTATAWSGVLLMTAWTKTLAAVAVVAAAGLAWWSLHEPNAVLPSAGVVAVEGVGTPASGPAVIPVTNPEVAAASAIERSDAAVAAASKSTRSYMRGRCVDERGAPLAGCSVSLHAWASDEERVEAWRRDHGQAPEWEAPGSQKTGTDGAFAFEFWPPPFRFALHLMKEGLVPMSGSWPKIEEGERIDVGDVVCVPGVSVSGHVVDDAGRPIAKARFSLEPVDSPKRAPVPRGKVVANDNYRLATADDEGRFRCGARLVPGRYEVRIDDRDVANPTHVELSLDRAQEDLTIVVRRVAEQPTISGRVVDEAGEPVANARVSAEMAMCDTRRDGTFVLPRRAGATSEAVQLSVAASGFEAVAPTEPQRWGASDVEIHLVRGGSFTVRIVDPEDAPVADYFVRMIPREVAGRPYQGSEDSRVRARGPFENGTATVPDITCGRWLAVVEFPVGTGLATLYEIVEVPAHGRTAVNFRAERCVERPMRVLGGDGNPVVGTRVQLCELFGRPLRDCSIVFDQAMWLNNAQNSTSALVLSESRTDATGRVSLRGLERRVYALRVLGPGHVPCEVAEVGFDTNEVLVVTVVRGARLIGRIVPPEAVAELRRISVAEGAAPREFPAQRRPSLWFEGSGGTVMPDRRSGAASGAVSPNEALQIRDDGSFDVAGVPPGSCLVGLSYYEAVRSQSIQVATGKNRTLTRVELEDGVTTNIDLDLRVFAPGTLEGIATINGVPCAKAKVVLEASFGPLPDGSEDTDWINIETDAQGQFTHHGRAGVYRLRVLPALRALATATVVSGQTTRHTFAVLSGTLQLKVLDAAGKPAANVDVHSSPNHERLPLTSSDGTTTVQLTADNITLRVLPKRLQSQEAQNKAWNEARTTGQTDPFAPHWLPLGTATITAGQTTTLELRLPPEWEK